jgi:hypothetical protein
MSTPARPLGGSNSRRLWKGTYSSFEFVEFFDPTRKNLPQLQELHLRGTQVTDAGLHHLEGMTNLDELDLTDTKVTAAGVETLQQSLPACKITVTSKAP